MCWGQSLKGQSPRFPLYGVPLGTVPKITLYGDCPLGDCPQRSHVAQIAYCLPGSQCRFNRVTGIKSVREHCPPIRYILPQFTPVRQPIIQAINMRTGARPAPFFCGRHNSGFNRVAFDIADCEHHVPIIHRVTCKAALKKMTAGTLPEIDPLCVFCVNARQWCTQSVKAVWNEHQVDMVVHQTPCKASGTRTFQRICQYPDIVPPVTI